jgi:hypothetical protein
MANRAAAALGLRDGDRERLVSLTRSSSVRAGLAQRARIVLLAAEGVSNTAIAAKVGVTRHRQWSVGAAGTKRVDWRGSRTSHARVGRVGWTIARSWRRR